MDQKPVINLHNGILCSRKKEGALMLQDSMDGTGEPYAKWSKPGSERQIPYDLTYKWNLINKTNKQTKYNQRHGNKEQVDSDQMWGGKRMMGKVGEGSSKNMYKGPMDKWGGLNVSDGGG